MRKRENTIDDQDKFITLEALDYLGYGMDEGTHVKYGEYEGELLPVWDETGVDVNFCCLYLADREIAMIIPERFEDALETAALERY